MNNSLSLTNVLYEVTSDYLVPKLERVNSKIYFCQLFRAKNEFVILKDKDDSENYKIKLLSCFLYVPVAQLSSAAFTEIERVLTSKSVAIHYRKIEIRNLNLTAGKEEYNSENLFSSDCPCRVVIGFIESKNKTGSPTLNPFDFKRAWKVTVASNQEDSQISQREQYLEQKLLDFEKQLAFFKSCVTLVSVDESQPQTSKGKGRGKRTVQAPETQTQSPQSFFDRFRPSFSGASAANADTQSVHSEHQSTSQQSQHSGNNPPSYSEATATEKTIYIKQVDLLLNGAPLDQLDTRETGN